LHAWAGGFYSGLISTFLSFVVANFVFSNNFSQESQLSATFIITTMIFIGQAIIISFLTSNFARRIRKDGFVKRNLEYKESMLKNIIDTVYGFIVVTDQNGNIIENNEAYQLFQKNSESLEGKSIFDTYPWKNNLTLGTELREWFSKSDLYGQYVQDSEFKLGSVKKFFSVNLTTINTENSTNPTKLYVVSGMDITDRKIYEQELESVKNSYTKLVDSNIVGMTIEDSSGHVYDANDAFLNLVGYNLEDFTKNNITRKGITPKEYYAHIERSYKSLEEKGYSIPFQKEYVKSNGERVPVLVASVLIDEKNMRALTLTVDISAQQKVLNLKDEFIGVITHELKTPLMTLQGYVDILERDMDTVDKKDLKKYVDIISRQNVRLSKLVNDLIDFIKLSKDSMVLNTEEFELVEFINRIANEIDLLNTNHVISVKSNKPKIIVSADLYRIEQVITNLLTNAIKFSPQDKGIIIEIEQLEKTVKVSVTDFGIGIPKEDISKVFDKFFQVKMAQPQTWKFNKSMGLGLYISSEIVKKHKGKIGVKSELNKSTTFFFTLPTHIEK